MHTIDVFGLTHIGLVRSVNEDQFLVAALEKSTRVLHTSLERDVVGRCQGATAHLLMVADGLGGMGGGSLASGTALAAITQHISETVGCFYNFDVELEHEFLDRLEEGVERAHQQVVAQHAAEGQRPATTLTMVALAWPRAYVVHVGDSRAYYLRRGRLRQLTRDQTVYEELVDQGVVPEDAPGQGERNRFRDVLTSAVGVDAVPSIGLVDLVAGDALVLCTDGLTKHVPDDEIARVVGASASSREACDRLLAVTLDRGARDNVTIVIARSVES